MLFTLPFEIECQLLLADLYSYNGTLFGNRIVILKIFSNIKLKAQEVEDSKNIFN